MEREREKQRITQWLLNKSEITRDVVNLVLLLVKALYFTAIVDEQSIVP